MLKYELSVLLFTSLMNEHFPRGSTKISLIKSKEENREFISMILPLRTLEFKMFQSYIIILITVWNLTC